MFEYLPLKAGELTGRLSFSSSELGVYQYDLNLTATPAGTEAPVHFRAGLGTSQGQTCRFVNFAKSKVEYSCKVIKVAHLSFQDGISGNAVSATHLRCLHRVLRARAPTMRALVMCVR